MCSFSNDSPLIWLPIDSNWNQISHGLRQKETFPAVDYRYPDIWSWLVLRAGNPSIVLHWSYCKEKFCLSMILGGHKVKKSSKSRISLQIPIVNYNGNLEDITTFQLCDHLKSWSDNNFHYSFFVSPCTWRALPSFKFTSQSERSCRNGEGKTSNTPPHYLSQITSFIL